MMIDEIDSRQPHISKKLENKPKGGGYSNFKT